MDARPDLRPGVTSGGEHDSSRDVALGIGPFMLVAGVVIWFVSDRLGTIGPFDRATIGWAIVVPLLALAPGVAALAERRSALVRRSRLIAGWTSVVVAAFVLAGLSLTITWAGCRPVSSPLDILQGTLPAAIIAGVGYAVAYTTAAGLVARGSPGVAVLGGAVVWIIAATVDLVVLFVVAFPALSCAAPSS